MTDEQRDLVEEQYNRSLLEDEEDESFTCCVCGRVNTEEEDHSWHTTPCAVVRGALATVDDSPHDALVLDCQCDGQCCPECCPVCAAESMIAPIRSHLQWVEDVLRCRT